MEANEMESGSRNKRWQTWHELQRRHHEMSGSIPVWGFELQDDPASTGAGQPFVAKGGARDVATEAFEGGALLGTSTTLRNIIRGN